MHGTKEARRVAAHAAFELMIAQTSANQPTSIRFKIGDDTLFNEAFNYRRALMFERFGFDIWLPMTDDFKGPRW